MPKFVFSVILTISYLRAKTIETSSLPTDSSQPLFKQIEIFSILTVWLYISTVSTFLNIRASYYSASSGFRLLGEVPTGAIEKTTASSSGSRYGIKPTLTFQFPNSLDYLLQKGFFLVFWLATEEQLSTLPVVQVNTHTTRLSRLEQVLSIGQPSC